MLGDGLAAWALADALEDAGRDAVLLCEATEVESASPSLGVARLGPSMHLARLAAGHGEARAAACVRAGLVNREQLFHITADRDVPVRRCGTLRFASDGDEAAEMQRSVRLLQQLDRPADFGDVRTFVDDAPSRFTHAALHPDDACVDVDALVRAMAQRNRSHVRVVHGCRVRRIDDEDGVGLQTAHGLLCAEVVVVAAETLLARLVSFCRFKIVALRTQALSAVATRDAVLPVDPRGPAAAPPAWSAVHGYENWLQEVDDRQRVQVSGSRDLPVQKELGARRGTSPEVQALLEANLRDFARWRAHRVESRWSSLQGVSCDGLPLVGAVPGHARVLVCGGFGINDVGWAFVSARTITELLEHGRAEHDLVLSPRRFL